MEESFAEGIRKVEERARFARIALTAFIAWSVANSLEALGEAAGAIDITSGEDALTFAAAMILLGYLALFIVCMITVGMWIHAAHTNVRRYGGCDPEISPGWAVGWFFIPFANLFKPYQAMHQLWKASSGDLDFHGAAPPLLVRWWSCWVLGNILSSTSSRMVEDIPAIAHTIDAVSSLLLIAAAKFLIDIIREITAVQRGGTMAANVFA